MMDSNGSIMPPLPNKPRGVPRADDRRVLNGIYWRLRTGRPGGYSGSGTAPRRPATTGLSDGASRASGTGSSMRSRRPMMATADGPSSISAFISTRPTSRGAAGCRRGYTTLQPDDMALARRTDDHDALSMPTAIRSALKLTEGQAHDSGKSASDCSTVSVPARRCWPIAGAAYDSDALREKLAQPWRLGQRQTHAAARYVAGAALPLSSTATSSRGSSTSSSISGRRHALRKTRCQLPRRR